MLYASERGFALPDASEELTNDRRARTTVDLPATALAGRLYLLARCYPDNRLPLVVTVNGRYLAPVQADDLAGRYAWYEVAIPCDVLRTGENVIECWCDTEAMDGWSLAIDYGSGSTTSQVSTDAGTTWSSDHIGYLNIGRGDYIVRIRLAEGSDPPPPAMLHEDPGHVRLGRLRATLPAEAVGAMPVLQRLRTLATWTSTQWPYRNEQQATQYAPWDPATILAWGRAESGHDGRLPIVMCVHYTIVFVAACEALGLSARCVVFAEELNSGIGHFVAEVWVPELAKWVLVDPNLDAVFLRDGTPLSAREVQAASEGLSTLVSWGPGHDYQTQTSSMRAWIAQSFLTGACFRYRAVWPRTDFMSHPECSPPFHGATAYSELDLVWEQRLADDAAFGMFRYFAPESWFDEPPRQPAVPDAQDATGGESVAVDSSQEGHVSRRFMAGKASVVVAGSTQEAGALAASIAADTLIARVAEHGSASVILASGNSQLAFFASLRERTDIPWARIAIFHMDEYIGLDASHPKGFRRYFRDQLVDGVHVRAFHEMAGDAADIAAEMRRYTNLLRADPPDICVLGIGENCHLAFNDPPADFTTTDAIHVVEVSLASRRQQVGEGHFPSVEDVPTHALTLTIPTLLAPAVVLAVVPESRKAAAVAATLEGPISPDVPATILRDTDGVTIVLDPDSAARLG